MKKSILALMVALVLMMMPVLSMAEAAEELDVTYLTYTHTDDQYSLMYPDNWILLNAENIEAVMDEMSKIGNEELANMVSLYGPQVQQLDMVMLLNESTMTNVNFVCQTIGMHAEDDVLLGLAPNLISQLSSSFEGIQFINEGTIIDLNGKNGMMLEYIYELSGVQMHGVQMYISGETNLYVCTYTCGNADELSATSEDFGFMLGSMSIK